MARGRGAEVTFDQTIAMSRGTGMEMSTAAHGEIDAALGLRHDDEQAHRRPLERADREISAIGALPSLLLRLEALP